MIGAVPRFVDDIAKRKRDAFESGNETSELFARQRGEEMVIGRNRKCCRCTHDLLLPNASENSAMLGARQSGFFRSIICRPADRRASSIAASFHDWQLRCAWCVETPQIFIKRAP